MSSEKTLLSKIELLASSLGHLLFRNNNGYAWVGKPIKLPSGDLILKNPSMLNFGLIEGSGDLIGGTRVKITNEMVGRTFLIFTSYEVKTKNTKTTKQQLNFANVITKLGGIAIIDKFTKENSIEENSYVESINQFSSAGSAPTAVPREPNL